MDDAERRTRLVQWLEIIFQDVQDLLLDDHLFWELQSIVRTNPRFAEASGLFTQWIASSFIQATAVGVRRQAKADGDSVSLKRFLCEVRSYPSLVSRDHCMSLYSDVQPWVIEVVQEDFNRLAGQGSHCLPDTLLDGQLRQLDQAVAGIEHYVDRRIAHYDQRGLAHPTPTFTDLSGALKTLESIVILYWRWLKCEDLDTMLPKVQHDYEWKDIFRFAWDPQVAETESDIV